MSEDGALKDAGAIYSDAIDNTDRAIARLLAQLRQVAPPENTLVFYASGIRVPGIIEWPAVIQPRVTSFPACVMDLFPPWRTSSDCRRA